MGCQHGFSIDRRIVRDADTLMRGRREWVSCFPDAPTEKRVDRTSDALRRTAGPAHPPHVIRSRTSSSVRCAARTTSGSVRRRHSCASARDANTAVWSMARASPPFGTSSLSRALTSWNVAMRRVQRSRATASGSHGVSEKDLTDELKTSNP